MFLTISKRVYFYDFNRRKMNQVENFFISIETEIMLFIQ